MKRILAILFFALPFLADAQMVLYNVATNAEANSSWTGPVWVYRNSNANYALADTDVDTMTATALCLMDSDSANAYIQIHPTGTVVNWPSALTPGATYYLSSTAGAMVATKPDGHYQVVGMAVDTYILQISIGPRIIQKRSTEVVLGSNYDNSSTTEADVSGLSLSLESGVHYRVRMAALVQTAATTTGTRFNMTFSGTGTPIGLWTGTVTNNEAASALNAPVVFGADYVTTAVQAINTDHTIVCDFDIIPTSNGTLQIKFGSEVASSNASLRAGSFFYAEEK